MVNRMLLDHEFFMKKPMLRFILRASCNSGGQHRGSAMRPERQSNLPVGSQVLEAGAWQSRSLPYGANRGSYGEAAAEIEVFALSMSRVSGVAGSVRLACCSAYPFRHTLKFWIDRNRAPMKMSGAFDFEKAHEKDGRLSLWRFRPRSKFPPFSRLRTGIRPRIFG